MLFLSTLFLALLPLGALAGKHQDKSLRSRHANHARTLHVRNNTKTFVLQDMYTGQSFLNDWDFFSDPDPTHGSVNFQTKDQAIAKNLAFVQSDGTTVLAVDDTSALPPNSNRDSIRITSKKTYNGGLFIADFWAMPHGCSVWPAYWSVGPNWPSAGEIDVLEGVHNQPTNQYTLHTGPGCTLNSDNNRVSANAISSQCASSGDNNNGCAFIDTDTRSYGKPFNMIGGGVYAHLWNSEGIKMWHFARGEIPADINAKQPNPASWPTPAAFWSAKSCNMNGFHDHQLVIDTTLCGDFAGATYASAGCPGTCGGAVQNPANFRFAKWKINYIATYQ
ncbi:glycoside hydrolase family 16 protein [Laccaria bicolor S238N-H82]|uniref:Glycoside hydrolase family 16 protein n=1 Tax=Laccaria bicolor (strain S238N-H82 / ATCC MYA-4686) TaxID=486041 RepID=B0CTZ7_LACBS|nr:glycoside hydrolase family 16 protein [Laccaria bicolor S238N-H82]EDR14587.1 glycoside hydrolase family 16 protein [Laccaria bicolor S238N-H82]|eukprot:XP_001875146.1 glycoside hydrolase family 16 protein [Laccaria bicolor S238N-H82]